MYHPSCLCINCLVRCGRGGEKRHNYNENKGKQQDSRIGKIRIVSCDHRLLLFYFHAAFNADGQNVFAPAVAERLDLNPGVVLSMNSIAGLIGVLISVISGQLNRRIGPRKVCSLTFLLGGIAYIMAANAPNIAVYTIAMCFSLGGGLSAALFVGFGAPNANWFPKRLGSVMGLVTIGAGMTTMTYIAAFNKLVSMVLISIVQDHKYNRDYGESVFFIDARFCYNTSRISSGPPGAMHGIVFPRTRTSSK